MHLLILDPFHGAAGDMITGALLDCGADTETVIQAMRSVVAEPRIARVTRAGISAVKVDTRAGPAHRTLADVMERLDAASSNVPAPALALARKVFERIHAAEERVHGSHVRFHEVGADDAIADIIGACTALHSLGIDGVAVLPVALGRGTTQGSHGVFPIPAPATAAIIAGSGLVAVSGPGDGELCTPTGAALLAEFLSVNASDLGAYRIVATGFGAGTRDPPGIPNVLRAMVVETVREEIPGTWDTVDILETSVDDVSSEVIADAIARFMEAGARDASAVPVIMKKGRPGFLIRVICAGDNEKMAELMARELGSLGVRCIPVVHRFIAKRSIEEVEVTIGTETRSMPVKRGWIGRECYMLKAEFDPARDWARELNLPVRDVIRVIEETARGTPGQK
jgi:uncharacterized protein (TIGR00299 family) protein